MIRFNDIVKRKRRRGPLELPRMQFDPMSMVREGEYSATADALKSWYA